MTKPKKRKPGRPRKELPAPLKAWTMIIQYRPGCKKQIENIPGSWSEDEGIQRLGVPRHAKVYRMDGKRRTVIQHPR